MTFHCDTFVIRTRKEHYCEQCGKMISVGSGAFKYVGSGYDGFYNGHMHDECYYASREYAEMCDAWGEEYPWFQHMELEHEDRQWLLDTYPALAERLRIWQEPYE